VLRCVEPSGRAQPTVRIFAFRAAFSIAPRDRRLIDGYRAGILSFRGAGASVSRRAAVLARSRRGARQRGATGG